MLLSGSGWERNVGKADPAKPSHDREGAETGTQAIMAARQIPQSHRTTEKARKQAPKQSWPPRRQTILFKPAFVMSLTNWVVPTTPTYSTVLFESKPIQDQLKTLVSDRLNPFDQNQTCEYVQPLLLPRPR
jgi:hypothetical protein